MQWIDFRDIEELTPFEGRSDSNLIGSVVANRSQIPYGDIDVSYGNDGEILFKISSSQHNSQLELVVLITETTVEVTANDAAYKCNWVAEFYMERPTYWSDRRDSGVSILMPNHPPIGIADLRVLLCWILNKTGIKLKTLSS